MLRQQDSSAPRDICVTASRCEHTLEPQHFQQQDWYRDTRLRRYFHLLVPFSWRVRSLTVNKTALQNVVFQVEQCEVVSWDGTILRSRGDAVPSNAKVEPPAVRTGVGSQRPPLTVYLGVRRLQIEESNVPQGGRNRSPWNRRIDCEYENAYDHERKNWRVRTRTGRCRCAPRRRRGRTRVGRRFARGSRRADRPR
jgi:hypothetical protein